MQIRKNGLVNTIGVKQTYLTDMNIYAGHKTVAHPFCALRWVMAYRTSFSRKFFLAGITASTFAGCANPFCFDQSLGQGKRTQFP